MQRRAITSTSQRARLLCWVVVAGFLVNAAFAQKFPWQDTPEAGGKTPQTVRFAGPEQTEIAARKPQVVEAALSDPGRVSYQLAYAA